MTYKLNNGWFANVNGIDVKKHDVGLSSTTYTAGYPKGVLFHYTAGCGGDIALVLKSRNISVTFSVDQNGKVYEYLPVETAGWHAYDASHYFIGIEHSAYPGHGCELNDDQLTASAKLAAAIIEWDKDKHHFDIPIRVLKNGKPASIGIPDFAPGFIDHRQGKPDWNQNGHTDHLYHWTWDEYLAAIANPEGDDVASTQDYVDGQNAYQDKFKVSGDPGDPPADKPKFFKAGWNDARFAASHPTPVPGPAGPAGPAGGATPHTHSIPAGETGST